MSVDREHRVVAAGETIEVGGKQFTLRPITVQHLCDLEREALKYYKRGILETYQQNADILGDSLQSVLEKKLEEVSLMGVESLPQKRAYDARNIPITDKLRRWVENSYGEVPSTDNRIRAVLVSALDAGTLTPRDVRRMTGKAPIQGSVRYDQWWVTATMEGMVSFVALSIRYEHPEVTKAEIKRWSLATIAEAARMVENLTTVAVGNM